MQFNFGRIPDEVEVCEEMKPRMHRHLVLCNEIFVSYVAGPKFLFRCNERGVHTGVGAWVGNQSLEVWGLSPGRH